MSTARSTAPQCSSRPTSSAPSRLLKAALDYWRGLDGERRDAFRFHHVSTDEVFGDLPLDDGIFTEETPYAPSSPYSASKAASDHLVRAWHETYGLPVVLSNCSNNYGPFHFPEKLIPLVILNALDGKPLPVYGEGANVRDWLYVDDHARALELVADDAARSARATLSAAIPSATISPSSRRICDCLDAKAPLTGRQQPPRPDPLRHGPPRPRPPLRHRPGQDRDASSAGAPARASKAASTRPSTGTSTTTGGGGRSASSATPAKGSARRSENPRHRSGRTARPKPC